MTVHCYQCKRCLMSLYFFFFFQAEDGIRDVAVTGVQTCALPISHIIEAEQIFHPDYVVPKDYLGDMDSTVHSIHEFHEEYDGKAEPLIPLQPPYVKSYERVRKFGGYFAIGSVRDAARNVDWIATRK